MLGSEVEFALNKTKPLRCHYTFARNKSIYILSQIICFDFIIDNLSIR